MSQSIQEWLSDADEALDEPSPKRRRLSEDCDHRSRAKSDPAVYSHALTPPSHSPGDVDVAQPAKSIDPEQQMADGNRQMLPPPSPRKTQSGSGTRSYSASNISKSSSRASNDQIDSATYRIRILAVNNVFFRRRHEILPPSIRQLWSSISSTLRPATPAAQPPELNPLLDAMYAYEGSLFRESDVRKEWERHEIFPRDSQKSGLCKTDSVPFSKSGLPRSNELEIPTISQPFPDLACGYNFEIFPSVSEGMKWENTVLSTSGMGENLWQATNQCAGGGSVCVNAIASLLDRRKRLDDEAHQANDDGNVRQPDDGNTSPPSEDPVGSTFSLAIDTEFARLHVHWRDRDQKRFFLHPIQSYDVWDPVDLARLQRHLSVIVAWGMGDRLDVVKETLNRISTVERRKRSYIESLG